MNKNKMLRTLSRMSIMLCMFSVLYSCKNKKKVTDMSDPVAVSAEIEAEMEQAEEPKADERVVVNEPSTTDKLNGYFKAIASAPTVPAANGSIQEALSFFTSSDVPVLIVIYQADGTTDYDEPTTIAKYLDYVKDTKNANAVVEEIVRDPSGKIKELVLSKKR